MKDFGLGLGLIALGIVLIPELKFGGAPPKLVLWLPISLIALGGIIESIMALLWLMSHDRYIEKYNEHFAKKVEKDVKLPIKGTDKKKVNLTRAG